MPAATRTLVALATGIRGFSPFPPSGPYGKVLQQGALRRSPPRFARSARLSNAGGPCRNGGRGGQQCRTCDVEARAAQGGVPPERALPARRRGGDGMLGQILGLRLGVRAARASRVRTSPRTHARVQKRRMSRGSVQYILRLWQSPPTRRALRRSPRAPMLHLLHAAVAQVDLSSGLSSGSSASSFDRLVLHGDKTLLVMFGAPWCSHCKTLAVSCSPLLPAVTLLARLTAFVSCIMVCVCAR